VQTAAIDQGTTSTRVLVATGDGGLEIRHALRHQQHHPRPGWVEHDPRELLDNIRTCLSLAGPVDGVGLSNQGESCLAWDAVSGEPLSPVIVWQDSRTAAAIDALRADGAEAVTLDRAGLPLDPYFSASKLAWILQNSDAAGQALRRGRLRLGTTDAYFLDRLTGAYATDVTTASRTSLMNLATRQWDADLCRLFGVPGELLPEIRPTVGDFGGIDRCPVTASMVDQQAALYGHGCRRRGDAKITFGTGAFALALTGTEIVRTPERGLLPTVAWQIGADVVYAVEGGVYNAGSAVEWAGRLSLFGDLRDLAAFSQPPAIGRGLAFVPALSGLACPHWDRHAAATWIGMSLETSASDLCQSLLEGIALRAAEVIAAMQAHLPVSGTLSIDGGLARSPYFAQFLADALERPIVARQFDELTSFGCASLAAIGLGQPLAGLPELGTTYAPTVPTDEARYWRQRFAAAVTRAKGWR
jgi:glycerol kinase